jgi:hypothetical protein
MGCLFVRVHSKTKLFGQGIRMGFSQYGVHIIWRRRWKIEIKGDALGEMC